ncbi:Ig-like domain-containing protein [Enterobacterales bacterium AW_CKDN230030176-1A_HGKHYDSX7]
MSSLEIPRSHHTLAGWLNPERLPPQGIAIDIELDTEQAGKALTVVLAKVDGTQLAVKKLPVNHNDQSVTLWFARHFFDKDNGRLKVYYTLDKEGPSAALEFDVTDGFSGVHTVDVSSQPVPIFYQNGVIKLPQELPDSMQFVRPLAGATGYESSDESIATVDNTGRVSVLRNGSTTIAATLADGARQQYVLVVRGLIGLEMLASSATFDKARTLCRSMSMRMPKQTDFALFKKAYGRQLGQWLPNVAIWGEAIGADSAWTFHPHTSEITGEPSAKSVLRQVAGMY